MASVMRSVTSTPRSKFFGHRAVQAAVAPVRSITPRGQVSAKALFGLFGGKKEEDSAQQYYICIDCGFIYDGDFKSAPASYKCPACTSGKNRFKVGQERDFITESLKNLLQ
ncbi:hypothetical protein CEUSTIGMA_g12499.t1 [Chlamydomonas eustigma]|uniref:Rubredoxin-like domain-containing protein n=1 Tax=Chlamydomonas eustigma TaxID=1157962 RepID=A0A250XQ57_9CHLO|nr:hypothetical protein CEUSTIGMA_g12499.t1 [Chlamydomonas eustigma]|eukprot:GAX85079.1 hypothetical protein CEUSTIGMA_g12499.t1 [Chlamydomonas eustigma]